MVNKLDLEDRDDEPEIDEVIVDPKAIPDIDSKYRLILLTAQRAKQLQRGATPRVKLESGSLKPTTIARAEFDAHKVNFTFIEREPGN